MSKAIAIGAGILLLVLLLLYSMTYTVRFHEVAILTRFGKTGPGSVVSEPGLNFKLPFFIDRVVNLDTRLQMLETPLETIPTRDEQQVVVRAFLMWRVKTDDAGPLLEFFRNYGTPEQAKSALEDDLRAKLTTLSQYSFDELIGPGSRLKEAETTLLNEFRKVAGPGVEPVTVGISQVLLPAKTTTAVLGRMAATQKVLADAERGAGESEAATLRAETKSRIEKIRAVVRQRAEEIRAQGDAKAADYYTQMAEKEDFAIFLIQLAALRDALSEYTTLILPTSDAPWHLMNLNTPRDENGMPKPSVEAPFAGPGGEPTTGKGQ